MMLDDFLTQVQVEETINEALLEEMHEYYIQLEKEYEKESDQS